jgi:WD40 repeat protein
MLSSVFIYLRCVICSADCRICVWNASDGSLVHSLIGHKESVNLVIVFFLFLVYILRLHLV